MQVTKIKYFVFGLFLTAGIAALVHGGSGQSADSATSPVVPKVWDDEAMATVNLFRQTITTVSPSGRSTRATRCMVPRKHHLAIWNG
jgi:hypothetical protein